MVKSKTPQSGTFGGIDRTTDWRSFPSIISFSKEEIEASLHSDEYIERMAEKIMVQVEPWFDNFIVWNGFPRRKTFRKPRKGSMKWVRGKR